MKKETLIKDATILFTFLFVAWGLYRLIIKLPDEVEELLVKPVIWILPTLYFALVKEKDNLESVGITFKNLFPSVYFAIALGSLFGVIAMIVNFVKYGGTFNFGAYLGQLPLLSSIGLSFATAISEEITFRGFIFSRLEKALENEVTAIVISSVAWTAIHVPITIFVLKLAPSAAIIYLLLTFAYGIGAAFVYARTRNILSPIFLHVLWEWPIILFR
ncbi:MAG: type II CAAX endopeptidase family protein [Patescibacteria group bacterium]